MYGYICEDRLLNIFIISKNNNDKQEISWAYIQSGIQDSSIKSFCQLIINYLVTSPFLLHSRLSHFGFQLSGHAPSDALRRTYISII